MGKINEEIKEKFAFFRKRRMKRFEYDSRFYMLWLLLSFVIWTLLLVVSHFVGEGFHTAERLFWWFWILFSMFIWQQKNSNLVFKHNMQLIDVEFRELFDARVNVSVIKELIELKSKKGCGGNCKCSSSCKKKKDTKSSTTKKTSSAK